MDGLGVEGEEGLLVEGAGDVATGFVVNGPTEDRGVDAVGVGVVGLGAVGGGVNEELTGLDVCGAGDVVVVQGRVVVGAGAGGWVVPLCTRVVVEGGGNVLGLVGGLLSLVI